MKSGKRKAESARSSPSPVSGQQAPWASRLARAARRSLTIALQTKPRKKKLRTRKRQRPGPKPTITVSVVRRVADRIGRGLTLALALSAESCATINVETWKKALQAHPEFSPLYEAGKGKFLDWSTKRIVERGEFADLRWLLERRHADLFARPAEVSVSVSNTTNISGLPDDILERARVVARTAAKQPGAK